MELKRVAIDTSKHVFTLHGVDAEERPVLRRELRRSQVEGFFSKLAATEVVLEACGASHHWGRTLARLGHRVKLIPPQYVKPFVKRGKNDRNDAEAIGEAASRPTMRFVPVKSEAEQAGAMVLRVRGLLVKQRTQLINALRGHAAEFGVVAAAGKGSLAGLAERITAATNLPAPARDMLGVLQQEIARLNDAIGALNAQLTAQHQASAMSRLLAEQPGVGPITAQTAVLTIDPRQFRSGRHVAAWLGLTPRQHSTAGKQRLGRIGKQGHEELRRLLVIGAMSVIKVVGKAMQDARKPPHPYAAPWLLALLARKPRRVAAVALANKMARILWAMMTSGEAYRHAPAAHRAAAA